MNYVIHNVKEYAERQEAMRVFVEEEIPRVERERGVDHPAARQMRTIVAQIRHAIQVWESRNAATPSVVVPPLDASFFLPTEIEDDGTIAQKILAHVAGMRKRDELHQSLCWSPEELELLAMFAIAKKNDLLAAQRSLATIRSEIDKLRAFAEDIRDNWDHDEDAHRHKTPCRMCEAEHVLSLLDREREP